MILKFVLLIFFAWTVFAKDYRISRFKKFNVSCYEVLEENHKMKTMIECCGYCLTKSNCQGVIFKESICSTLGNLVLWGSGSLEIMVKEKDKNELTSNTSRK